eukprot:SAG31_NODE_2075_length_6509_cov_2.710764_7_plen_429_part_00
MRPIFEAADHGVLRATACAGDAIDAANIQKRSQPSVEGSEMVATSFAVAAQHRVSKQSQLRLLHDLPESLAERIVASLPLLTLWRTRASGDRQLRDWCDRALRARPGALAAGGNVNEEGMGIPLSLRYRRRFLSSSEAISFVPPSKEPGARTAGQWMPMPELQMKAGRYNAAIVGLSDGSVVVAGGFHFIEDARVSGGAVEMYLDTVERYDPSIRRWINLPRMGSARSGCRAVWLRDGRLLVAGGVNSTCKSIDGRETDMLRSTEMIQLRPCGSSCDGWQAGPDMHDARSSFCLGQLPRCGSVIAAGGRGLSTAEMWSQPEGWPATARGTRTTGGDAASVGKGDNSSIGGWVRIVGLSTVRAYACCAILGSGLAVFGGIRTTRSGSPDGDPSSTAEIFLPAMSQQQNQAKCGGSVPSLDSRNGDPALA